MSRAPFASDPDQSRGRQHGEARGAERGPRTEYQRDRDRIIHSIAFRRLRGKTQVFIAPEGDHYRTRLTHSLEVAQIGRVIARALNLDEDLTEALCLGHDIGHPPFGHAGERALDEAAARHGGFDHNGHTLRTLAHLECTYIGFRGLNLTWDTLEGLAKHNGPVSSPRWALREVDDAYPLELHTHPSLEAQVAAISDDIAYDNHDMDDGLRAGYLQLDSVLAIPLTGTLFREVERRHPRAPMERLLRELIRTQIGVMVQDVIAETRRRCENLGSADEVRSAGRASCAFSPALEEDERRLKRAMYELLYYHPEQVATAERAREVVARLFAAYSQDAALLPDAWRHTLPGEEPGRTRHIVDFIAGMTDRYAMDRCAAIYGRVPGGLRLV
ncbi:deoxyguanosinetriphosphate triphosphohydrolase [Erythrobacteraceae bacterium CFH 75059]|uniref:deoxyguanosinetriphosphate triphosphohydrolase n=1 Tax=Qipengyuania thermophila TaxID=2509361 RepID=UPI0010215105|nr:deoxyguanosinetriphosphate triphosphohydrolase [Qipengyuania thermophila]TCD04903.1 deoxyguanosinetriphosphate triphosphohydrolase [Erythrobacteraceae bacterium CFH 75059]